jgi:hypothetical protein
MHVCQGVGAVYADKSIPIGWKVFKSEDIQDTNFQWTFKMLRGQFFVDAINLHEKKKIKLIENFK